MMPETIVWRGLHFDGHEHACLAKQGEYWQLEGVAVFSHEERRCRLDYRILCAEDWVTASARVWGWVGNDPVTLEIVADELRRWHLNGIAQEQVEGCSDIDLNFSPSTNLLPIRRLALDVGQGQDVRAAWLRFPGLVLEPLEQRYDRLARDRYRYTSGGGQFVADLQVNATGFITLYPDLWIAQ
jgi:hypothetical protein